MKTAIAASLAVFSLNSVFASQMESVKSAAVLKNQGLGSISQIEVPAPVPRPAPAAEGQKPDNLLLAKILMEADGGTLSPAREMSLRENSEILFDPYVSFSRRYQILSGSPFDKNLYDQLNQGATVNFDSCPKDYPNAPELREIFIIMWVIVDDYTGRTLECLLRYHLNRGTRVRVLIGEFFLTDFLKAKLEALKKIPLFEYKTIAGDFTGIIKNKNLAPHYKSMAVIGKNPKDSALIVGGRNLSDRYYFNNRPSLQDYLNIGQRPEGNNAGAGIFNDFDIFIKDHPTALNALDVSRLLWNRLSNNFTFELRLPLEDQLKILYSTAYDKLTAPAGQENTDTNRQPSQNTSNPWLDRVNDDLGIVKDLTLTNHNGQSVYHYEGIKLIPKLHEIISDDLLKKYPEQDLEKEVISEYNHKYPDDLRTLAKKEVSALNSRLTNFRVELYKKFRDAVDSSGLFKKVSGAFSSYYAPKFKEWYDNLYKTLDKMLFKRELFNKVNDLVRLFFKPEEGSSQTPLDSGISIEDVANSAREFDAVQSSITENNRHYENLGYGNGTEALIKLRDNPAFTYMDVISLKDYIYAKYYGKNRQTAGDAGANRPFFRYFASIPGQGDFKMEKMFVDLINASGKSIKFANCFFHPTPAIMTALKQAALRGVKIQITTNVSFAGDDDVAIPEQANAKAINEVIKLENFHLYRWDGTILHAKVYVFDDEAVFIGSTNMNTRTFYYNGENGVFIYDRNFVSNYIETVYNTHFINTGKHPFPNIKVSKIEGPVKEKGFLTRLITRIFNNYM